MKRRKNETPWFALIVTLLFSLNLQAAVRVTALTLDHLATPLGIDTQTPRFSWQLDSQQPATLQTAYEIVVEKLQSSTPQELWRSGKIATDQSLYIPYSGPELVSQGRYAWRVRVWDNHGNVSDWSDPAHFEMGLLKSSDWTADWITYPWNENPDQLQPSPLLRRDFPVQCAIESARLYITALGLYEVAINGERVGDAYFTPGWTSYGKRLQYQAYDVTRLIKTGDNAIGVALGDGWYRGYISWEMQRNLYGDRLAARAQLHIDCSDGSAVVVNSDTHWKAATGAVRQSDIYLGEVQDFKFQQAGWSQPGFDDRQWQTVRVFDGKPPTLIASASEPVRETNVLAATAISRGPNGETIVDFGQNMVGWVRLRARGQAGDEIRLRHAEVLNPDGSLYLDNLRNADQVVVYRLADDSEYRLQPRFSFQGFRYVSIEGYPGELTPAAIEAVVLHSDLATSGHFETSDALLNQLQSNIVWGQRGNFLEVPTDCPQRDERLGWTGDIQVFANTATFNMRSAAFFERWLGDVRADQFDNGGIPHVVPDVFSHMKITSWGSFFLSMDNAASGWGDVIAELPHTVYQRYGDRKPLEDSYDSMKRWVEFQRARAASWWRRALELKNWTSAEHRRHSRYIWNLDHTFGDWLAPVPLSTTFVNTVYFARSTQLLAEAAQLLGKSEDSKEYRALHQHIREAFSDRFLTAEGRLTEDLQGAYVLALQFDLLTAQDSARAAARLDALVRENGYHLATGFLSTPHLLSVLQKYGYIDTAYQVLMQRENPSWLYPVTMGATTIWERWDSIQPDGSFGDAGMNSFNHYAYGAVGDWMYRNIGGIAPAAPGYKQIRIAPVLGGGLTSATARLDSPYGPITSAWRIEGNRFLLAVDIPANTTAELILPDSVSSVNASGGAPLDAKPDAVEKRSRAEGEVLRLGSGHFELTGIYTANPLQVSTEFE